MTLGLAVACGLGVATECVAVVVFSRSIWIKLLPVPSFEKIELVGSAASGTVLDGHGGWFNDGRPTEIIILSRKTDRGWDRPENIVIRNGRLRGCIRIMGMGRNGQGRQVRLSSYREGHTARAQAAAPTCVCISNVEIEASGRIPVYLAPGAPTAFGSAPATVTACMVKLTRGIRLEAVSITATSQTTTSSRTTCLRRHAPAAFATTARTIAS